MCRLEQEGTKRFKLVRICHRGIVVVLEGEASPFVGIVRPRYPHSNRSAIDACALGTDEERDPTLKNRGTRPPENEFTDRLLIVLLALPTQYANDVPECSLDAIAQAGTVDGEIDVTPLRLGAAEPPYPILPGPKAPLQRESIHSESPGPCGLTSCASAAGTCGGPRRPVQRYPGGGPPRLGPRQQQARVRWRWRDRRSRYP